MAGKCQAGGIAHEGEEYVSSVTDTSILCLEIDDQGRVTSQDVREVEVLCASRSQRRGLHSSELGSPEHIQGIYCVLALALDKII